MKLDMLVVYMVGVVMGAAVMETALGLIIYLLERRRK